MTDPRKDIEGLQREMDETRADVQKVQKGETTTQQKNQSLDAVNHRSRNAVGVRSCCWLCVSSH